MRAAAVVGMVLLCGIAQGAEPKTVTNTIGMELIEIPAGKFTMGSPRGENGPQVAVTLTKPFWIGKTEVTQGQWKKVMGTAPWEDMSNTKTGEFFAATYVNWDAATAFCQTLTDLERKAGKLPAGESYRLPTEAQWEYACRAGTTTAFSFGEDESKLGEYAWFRGNAFHAGEKYAHKVGMKKPNPWGLYDMHGNVWEWCSDGYEIILPGLPGGADPVRSRFRLGDSRVIRGGSWGYDLDCCWSACRTGTDPSAAFDARDVGFRVARSQSAQ